MTRGRRSLASETVIATSGKVLMATTRFIAAIVFAHFLGPAVFGAAFLLLRVGNVACQVVIGWGDAAKKRLSEPDALDSSITGAMLTVATLWGIAAIAITLFTPDFFFNKIAIDRPRVYLGAFVAVESLAYAVDKLLEGQGRIGAASLSRAGRFVLAVPLQLWLLFNGLGGASILIGYTVAGAIVAIAAFVSLGIYPSLPSFDILQSQWSFSQHSIPSALLGTLYGSLDLLLLSAFLSTTEAGWYEAAWTLTMPAVFIAAAAASRLMVDVSVGRNNVSENISMTLGYSSIIAVPLLFSTLILAPNIVGIIFGTEFRPAAPFVVGLAIFQLIRTKVAPLLQVTYGLNRPDIITRISVIAVMINVVMGILLIILLGAIGVIVATIIAEATRLFIVTKHVKTEIETVKLITRPFGNQIASGIIMLIGLYIVKIYITPNSLGLLSVFVCLGIVIYYLILFIADDVVSSTTYQTLQVLQSRTDNF